MKRILILLLTICSFASFGQIVLDPTASTSSATRMNGIISGAFIASGTDTYTVNFTGSYSYTALTDQAISVTFPPAQVNTGSATLNFDGLGAKNIQKYSNGSLIDVDAGDLIGTIRLRYDGTQFVMEGGIGSRGSFEPRELPTVTYTAHHTLTLSTDLDHTVVCNTTAGGFTLTIPTNAAQAFALGGRLQILHIDTNVTPNALTLAASGGVTVGYSNSSAVSPLSAAGRVFLYYYKNNTNDWSVANGLPGTSGTVTSIATSNGITGGTITGTGTISGVNAAADGSTKGVSAFTATDFDASSGVISLDYINGQAASASNKGFLNTTDWSTFNGKQSAITFGTGVQTSLGVNIGSAGAPVLFNGAAGTPTSEILTNATGLPLTTGVTGDLPIANGGTGSDYGLAYVYPEDYGAVGDGSTNDQAAIASAVTAANSAGKPLYFSQKNYRVTSTTNIPSNTSIIGGGSASIISTTSNIPIFTITGTNATIQNLSFLGNDTGTSQVGIYALGDNPIVSLIRYGTSVINCRFTDLGGSGIYGSNQIGDGSSNHKGGWYINQCSFISNRYGIDFDTQCEYNLVENSTMSGNTAGIRMNAAGNNSYSNCNINDNTTGLLWIGGANDGHCVMHGCKLNHNTTSVNISGMGFGYLFEACMMYGSPITIINSTNIKFDNCDISATTITSTNNTGLRFFNNRFYSTTPTFTVTGTNPVFFNNIFEGTIPSILNNTIQGTLTTAPTATLTGFNVGGVAGDPSTLVNGDIWYNSSSTQLKARVNGSTVILGSAGVGDFSSSVSSSVDSEVVIFDGTAGKTGKRATGTGFAKLTSGVLSAQTSIDLAANVGGSVLPIANGGTNSTLGAWLLSGTSTMSAATVLSGGFKNAFAFGGSWSSTASSDAHIIINPSITGSSTNTNDVVAVAIIPTLIANANSQRQIGSYIKPVFTNGAFTGSINISQYIEGSTTGYPLWIKSGTATSATYASRFENSAGSQLLVIRSDGPVFFGSGLTVGQYDASYVTPSATANQYLFQHNLTPDVSGTGIRFRTTASVTSTSGDRIGFGYTGFTIAPTSGTATFGIFDIKGVVNQTSTSSGAIRVLDVSPTYTSVLGTITGINYNPTVTSVTGTHYGIVSVPTAALNGFGTATPNSTVHVSGSWAGGYVAKTGTYTATSSDYTIECTSGTFTVTLPTAVGITGRVYYIVNSGAGTITVGTTSSQTFVNVTATPTTITMATIGTTAVQSNGANWMKLSGL